MTELYWAQLLEPFDRYEISTRGVLMERGRGEVGLDSYSNGASRFELRNDSWGVNAMWRPAPWQVMLAGFYRMPFSARSISPYYVDGNSENWDFDNLIFGRTDYDGVWRELPWKPYPKDERLRYFDPRMGPKIRIVELDETFHTIQEVADRVGGYKSNISNCLKGRLKRYKGYTYEYVELLELPDFSDFG